MKRIFVCCHKKEFLYIYWGYYNLSPLQICMVCSRSKLGLYHSRYIRVEKVKIICISVFTPTDGNSIEKDL